MASEISYCIPLDKNKALQNWKNAQTYSKKLSDNINHPTIFDDIERFEKIKAGLLKDVCYSEIMRDCAVSRRTIRKVRDFLREQGVLA